MSYSRGYLTWSLVVLSAANVLNYSDRNVVNILLEPIKRDLALSDSQAGLLTGLAFTVVFSLMGVPLARIADRGHHVKVISGAIAAFSIMTVACANATSFATLLLARIGVGIGEAGVGPSTSAMIADYFSPQVRARAFSAVAVTSGLGIIFGMALGGYLSDRVGWRAVFAIMGAPGVIVALLAYLTLREPAQALRAAASHAAPTVSIEAALRVLGSRKSYVYMTIGLAIAAIGSYGLSAWIPAFFMRNYAMSGTKIGGILALSGGPGTVIGILAGGWLSDKLSTRDARWPLWLFMLGFGGTVPIYLVLLLSPSANLGLALSIPATIIACLWIAPGMALSQTLAGSQFRATAAAIFSLALNLVGLGIGPLAVGVISDALQPIAGAEALRYALCSMLATFVVGLVLFQIATRYVRADLDAIKLAEAR
ncbi:MAG TPA: MFS transporter [Nevskiaceae bacterium]|nr:MFS transporter [Nevskiaceae bacterium]